MLRPVLNQREAGSSDGGPLNGGSCMDGVGSEQGRWPRLDDIPVGEEVELQTMDLPESEMASLMERGVMPGCRLQLVRRSPFGDPVLRVEGTVLAVRRELAARLGVRRVGGEAA